MKHTITYSEKAKGWTSFHSFLPDWMGRLNNRFFTVKSGQLYLHNDETNPIKNNFYGVQYPSKITLVINESSSEDKIFKTIVLEGNRPWHAKLKTNYSNSTIKATEFNKIESRHFAYIRKNEDANDLHGNAVQGIGSIVSHSGNTITYSEISSFVSIGDALYQLNGSNKELIGEISNKVGNVITVNAIVTTPVNGYYSFSKKNARIEGSEIRGYYLEVELENTDTEKVELFAVNTNAVKSFI